MQWSLEHGMVVRRFGKGRELVWIHGLGEQSSSFDPIARVLSNYSHVLVDLPGYGRSPWPTVPAADSMAQLADHLAAWLPGPSVLVGHSMGGTLTTLIAERKPMRAIVNIDGNVSRDDCTLSANAAAFTREDFAAHGFDQLRALTYDRGIADPPRRGYYAAMRAASPEMFHQHSIDLVAESVSETQPARMVALGIPIVFIAGVPNGISERSRTLLEGHGVRFVGIEPSGHWPFIDQPKAFAATVTSFVDSLEA